MSKLRLKPRLAITMGDAAGIGPEIVIKALAHPDLYARCRPFVIGDAVRLAEAGRIAGVRAGLRAIAAPEEASFETGTIDCLDLGLIPPGLPFGKIAGVAGHAAYEYVRAATGLAMAHRIEGLVTAPLNKEALKAGGHDFPGHTELLASLTGTPEVSMMLTAPRLRVILVTSHMGLVQAVRAIEPGLVERTIARGREVLLKAGIARAKIAVCGLNPHAGEGGLFGEGEEESKIAPAITACQSRGWEVEGPLPADTLFWRARRGDFDLVVAMYHDQGLAPVKVLGLESGVNITVGLPVIRTSVDHGTAFDIAGKGVADERSLLAAIDAAIDLAPR
jgi:4-hydroxythreonine-4-phosphate dehydrogenase